MKNQIVGDVDRPNNSGTSKITIWQIDLYRCYGGECSEKVQGTTDVICCLDIKDLVICV